MAVIYRGTTPSVVCRLAEDLSDFDCYLSIGRVGRDMLTITNDQMEFGTVGDAHKIVVTLTQAQTLALKMGEYEMQLRAVNVHGEAVASGPVPVTIAGIIHEGAIGSGS